MPSIFEWTIASKTNNKDDNNSNNINNELKTTSLPSITVDAKNTISITSNLMVKGIIFLSLL